ncbi:DUF7687 domain-containing protein [Dyella tabacisoli]|uniref:Uncharacterized protein n=1 Tax=Dyella tabacisoli TaxID=2282381 RepID=A0A369UP66_9GAMM|nr:hypothetical protein [Dyella tabacisoli]RDD82267.1 hypothetical protein DVJ77_07545 [Dyella tabacisoli]
MKADPRFLSSPKSFWALVRTLSQHLGYTERGRRGEEGQVAIHSVAAQARALFELGLNPEAVLTKLGPTAEGLKLEAYFRYRAEVLNGYVQPLLMDKEDVRPLFEKHFARLNPTCPIPMNKQKNDKRAPAFLTGLVNMLVQEATGDLPCNYDPRELTTFTRDGVPVRTLARRVDGAFPSAVNPIALWEIKEYYYTTTFGSRVADGVYETLLDGLELQEMERNEGISAMHYLFVDSRFTWWKCGRSYLCRLIDMLNMGCATEVIFGREVLDRIPELGAEWARVYRGRFGTG